MPRGIIALAPLMLVAGLVIGSAATTLLWQGPMALRGKLVDDAQAQTKEALAIAEHNARTAKSCIATLKKINGSPE